jgi:hypothetical protein
LASQEDVACYRLYAVNCVEIAARQPDPERKFFFLKMAQAWGNLADRLDRAMGESERDGLAGLNHEAAGS